jgi:hypothetical protein
MKYLVLILALGVVGCSSTPKVLMKNCEKLKNGYYECEEIPKKNIGERVR